ncbi:MAG: hypothetical protein ACM3QW_08020 [Ignavibacteriales bacterium]
MSSITQQEQRWVKHLALIIIAILLISLSGCQDKPNRVVNQVQKPAAANQTEDPALTNLTTDYFVPALDHRYVFDRKGSETSARMVVTWVKEDNKYLKQWSLRSGEKGSDTYAIDSSGIRWLESTYMIPQSEGDRTRLSDGSNREMKFSRPGSTWDNEYQEADAFGNVTSITSNYTFVGMKKIRVMGKLQDAALIHWQDKGRVLEQAEASQRVEGYQREGDSWYVKDMGLVKSTIKFIEDTYEFSETMELVQMKDL